MKNLNVLLGNADRRANHRIEATLLDLCYGQAVVTIHRVARVDEFVRQGSWTGFDLIIVAPEDLLPCASQRNSPITLNQIIHAITSIRSRHSTPILAINAPEQTHVALVEAGVDNVLGMPLNHEQFRDQTRNMLRLSSSQVEEQANRWAWVADLFRGLQRLTQA